jgi:gamma-glutamylcyclotransferase (GGCT)/AIG2-like uncharacterized protein YtfP
LPAGGSPGTLRGEAVAVEAELPLFVYGSLRRSGQHHDVLAACGADWLGPGWVRGEVRTWAGYPALVPGEGWVAGELWTLPAPAAEALARLDEFEEAYGEDDPRSVYVRRVVAAWRGAAGPKPAAGRAEPLRAWAYLLHPRWWDR